MLTDKELQELVAPLIRIFERIELDMIADCVARFDKYDKIGGTLEWRLKKLEELGALNRETLKIFTKYMSYTEKELMEALKKAGISNFDELEVEKLYKKGYLKMNLEQLQNTQVFKNILNRAFKNGQDVFSLIKTKALQSQSQAYMDIINKAYIEVSSGFRSYDEAIQKALVAYADEGIKGASYLQNRHGKQVIVTYDLEATVRRDVVTAVNSTANESSIETANEMGYTHVEVSQHLGARVGKTKWSNHAHWQGKVYKIEGSDKYPNLVDETGYGDITGLGGVNCRHRTFPFIPGVSEPKKHIDEKENAIVYRNEQILRKKEREIRRLRREYEVIKQMGDANEKRELKKAILAKNEEIKDFCKVNNLKRQENREVIF